MRRLYVELISRLGFAHQSLRRTLLGVVVLTLFVVLISFLVLATYFVRIAEKITWQSRQRDTALAAASTVNNFMEMVQNSLELAGDINPEYLVQNPSLLENILESESALMEIVCVDAKGQLYASAYRDTSILANRFTIPQSSWFVMALQGKNYIGRMEISAQDTPYLILAVPGRQGGVVAGRLGMDLLWKLVADIRLGNTGQAYVVNEFGDIIAHPKSDFVLQRVNLANRREFETVLKNPDVTYQGEYVNFRGEDVFGSAFPVFQDRWVMFVEVDRSEIFALTRAAFLILGSSLLILTILVGVGANRILETKIFQPVRVLRAGVEKIGRGQLNYRIDVARRDEIAEVADAFNVMAYRLQQREIALERARDQALQATKFKDQLLAHVSHDLRTPLGVIIGNAEMLNEGVFGMVTAEQSKSIERILVNANRLNTLVGTLLDEAQLEAGHFVLTETSFPRERLLEGLEVTFAPLAREKGLMLTIKMETGFPPRLIGDLPRIQQILFNLIDNAIKFTQVGGVDIRFFVPDSTHWAFSVADSGPGIPPEMHQLIFEPFRQAALPSSTSRKGVGLGLSVVSQILAAIGGTINLESTPGKGSTFTVIIPIQE